MTTKTDTQVLDENIARAIESTARAIGRAVVDGRMTCVRCVHFLEREGEVCGLAGQRPPARVIAFGCKAFLEEIPF